jgi:alpha-ketoglutarate-dependent taurine dioxygenase
MTPVRLAVRPLAPLFGAEITGVDLREELSESTQDRIRDAWHEHGLLLFRGQELDPDQQLRVAKIFGTISSEGEYGEQNYVSNILEKAVNPHGELAFHLDHAWSNPLRGLMLYAIEVPQNAGGDTLFADASLAYKNLPAALRERISTLQVRHSYPDQTKLDLIPGPDPRPGAPTSVHPLALVHPVTGETILFLSLRHYDHLIDVDREEGLQLVKELHAYVDSPQITYRHVWSVGDLVVWDNVRLQHARTHFDRKHRRHLRRTQIGDPSAGKKWDVAFVARDVANR